MLFFGLPIVSLSFGPFNLDVARLLGLAEFLHVSIPRKYRTTTNLILHFSVHTYFFRISCNCILAYISDSIFIFASLDKFMSFISSTQL